MVQLVSVNVALPALKIAPPPMSVLRTELLDSTTPVKDRVPALNTAPPPVFVELANDPPPLPPVIVRFVMDTVLPVAIEKARSPCRLLLASIVRLPAPGPVMVRFLSMFRLPAESMIVEGVGRLN